MSIIEELNLITNIQPDNAEFLEFLGQFKTRDIVSKSECFLDSFKTQKTNQLLESIDENKISSRIVMEFIRWLDNVNFKNTIITNYHNLKFSVLKRERLFIHFIELLQNVNLKSVNDELQLLLAEYATEKFAFFRSEYENNKWNINQFKEYYEIYQKYESIIPTDDIDIFGQLGGIRKYVCDCVTFVNNLRYFFNYIKALIFKNKWSKSSLQIGDIFIIHYLHALQNIEEFDLDLRLLITPNAVINKYFSGFLSQNFMLLSQKYNIVLIFNDFINKDPNDQKLTFSHDTLKSFLEIIDSYEKYLKSINMSPLDIVVEKTRLNEILAQIKR